MGCLKLIRHNLSIRREPTPTDSITTETTAVTGGTELTTSVSVTESLIGSESSETKATASVSETQKTASSETTPETTGTVSESRQESRVTASSVTTAPTQPTYTVTSSTASSESQSGPAEHTAEYTTVPSETAPISSTTTTKWLAGLADSDRTTEPRIPSTPSIGDAEPFTIFSQPLVYVSIIEKQGAGSLQTVKMIPGVELQLLTLDKTVVCSWTSDGSEKELQLKADTPYYLHASSIPEGYVEPACDWFVMLRSGDIKGRQITFTLDRAEAKKEALT